MRRSALVLGILAASLAAASAGAVAQQAPGNRAYRRGDYADAAERYRRALEVEDAARGHYNLGTALMQLGEWSEAREELNAALRSQDAELRVRTFYNLGGAYAADETGDESDRRRRLRAAVESYRRTLMLDPSRSDAKWNLELALRRLQRLDEPPPTTGGPPRDDAEDRPQGGAEPGGRPADDPDRDGRSGAAPGPTGPQETAPATGESAPLPPALAEQILRAVEESERALQRERMRRRQTVRTGGPDW